MTLALIGALLIGLSLGLLGSGGSMLTVPVLVYLVGHAEKQAIAESLAIVGGIALVGAVPFAFNRLVNWRNVLFFGVPGMLGAYLGAFGSKFVSGSVQLVIFAVIMLLASYLMLARSTIEKPPRAKARAAWAIVIDGLIIGGITGFIGIGGGFMIVPALVLLGGLPMRLAIGTSLCIISMNATAGFIKHLRELPELGYEVNWNVIAVFLMVGIIGSLAGNFIGGKVPQRALQKGFAILIVLMALYILAQQTLQLSG